MGEAGVGSFGGGTLSKTESTRSLLHLNNYHSKRQRQNTSVLKLVIIVGLFPGPVSSLLDLGTFYSYCKLGQNTILVFPLILLLIHTVV